MNWDAVGAVAELVGAIGVILSLLYLAVQIRQGTKVARATGFQGLVENLQASVAELRDPKTAPLFLRGLESYNDLAPEDRLVFAQILGGMVARFATTLEFEASGIVNPSYTEAHGEIIKNLFASPGVREWWSSPHQNFLNREVRDWIERNTQADGKEPSATQGQAS